MTKYCSNCGKELPDEAMYCPDCGKEYIPRSKADFPESNNDSEISDYEFNGPFGPSNKKFEGPFGPHSNRGSYDSNISSNDVSLSSSDGSSSTAPNGNSSNQSSSNYLKDKTYVKIGLLLLIIIIIAGIVGMVSNGNDSNKGDNGQSIIGTGNVAKNEPYNISIDETAYLSGVGEVKLIDSNKSYNIESEEFNITEYETYYVNVNDDDWYVLDIFKCKFDTPAQSQVFSTDLDDGSPIIIYGAKGDYYGYGIIMPNTSDDSKYKNIDYLESIFHYKKE